jgi:mRNA-degrading endonuclease RelE of RelBE toxin-antitoxin system
LPYLIGMNTIVESAVFSRKVALIWNELEYEEFKAFIALNPFVGQVVPGTGGVRKIRWRSQSKGKKGGVRVIYYNKTKTETWLLTLYQKNELESMSAKQLKILREATHE